MVVMKTLQITMKARSVERLDTLVKSRQTNRSAMIRALIDDAYHKALIKEKERTHRDGYLKIPVTRDEFGGSADDKEGWTDDWDVWEKLWKEWSAAKSDGARSKDRTKRARSSSSPAMRRSPTSTKSRSRK